MGFALPNTDQTAGAFTCSACWRNMTYTVQEQIDGTAFESAKARHECKEPF